MSSIGMEKHFCYNIGEVTTYLNSIGFTISSNKILWNAAQSTTNCYWQINNGVITFKRSDGQSAFTKDLVNFNYSEVIDDETVTRPICLICYIPLKDNGIALYMGMVTEDTSLTEVSYTCANDDPVLNNGLVVLSPAENDGYWYYGWNSPIDNNFHWCLDNGHGNYEYDNNVKQLPPVKIYQTTYNISLTKLYLKTGYLSENIKCLVTGNNEAPGYIFKINNQKYITFTNNDEYRCPAYKLPLEVPSRNLSTSTEEYSPLKTYEVDDYCTYQGYLYRCISAITTPHAFDVNDWFMTTVHNELMREGNMIYGD